MVDDDEMSLVLGCAVGGGEVSDRIRQLNMMVEDELDMESVGEAAVDETVHRQRLVAQAGRSNYEGKLIERSSRPARRLS